MQRVQEMQRARMVQEVQEVHRVQRDHTWTTQGPHRDHTGSRPSSVDGRYPTGAHLHVGELFGLAHREGERNLVRVRVRARG